MIWFLKIKLIKMLFFVYMVLGFDFRVFTLSHSTNPFFFVMGFLEIGSQELFAGGWLQTLILLISAS
jgi:hypothetical protein